MPSIQELQQRAIEYAKSGDFGAQALSTNLELAKMAPTNEGALTPLVAVLHGGRTARRGDGDARRGAPAESAEHDRAQPAARSHQTSRCVHARRQDAAHARDGTRCRGRPRVGTRSTVAAAIPGIGRAEFAALGQLSPEAVVESLGSRIEPLADRAQRAAVCGQGRRDAQSRRSEWGAAVQAAHRARGWPRIPSRISPGSALGAATHDRTSFIDAVGAGRRCALASDSGWRLRAPRTIRNAR